MCDITLEDPELTEACVGRPPRTQAQKLQLPYSEWSRRKKYLILALTYEA